MNTLPEALTPEVLAGHVERITSYNAAVAERHLGIAPRRGREADSPIASA
jgi:hypothetical protein